MRCLRAVRALLQARLSGIKSLNAQIAKKIIELKNLNLYRSRPQVTIVTGLVMSFAI